MDESSLLELTAEVSVAVAGFISIFLVLAAREGRFSPGDAFTIRLIVICSIAPVFYAVLPLILDSFGVAAPMLWRSSSIAIGLAGVVIAVYMMGRLRHLEPGEGRKLNYGFVLGLVAVMSCAANALGWPWEPGGAMYFVTLWAIVGIAAGNFADLLFNKLL